MTYCLAGTTTVVLRNCHIHPPDMQIVNGILQVVSGKFVDNLKKYTRWTKEPDYPAIISEEDYFSDIRLDIKESVIWLAEVPDPGMISCLFT